VSVNEKKKLVMHMHVQLKLDELRGPPTQLTTDLHGLPKTVCLGHADLLLCCFIGSDITCSHVIDHANICLGSRQSQPVSPMHASTLHKCSTKSHCQGR
jgi:hypothetical protein